MKRVAILIVAVLAVALAGWKFWPASSRLHFEATPRSVLRDLGIQQSERPVLAVTENNNLYLLALDSTTTRLMLAMSHDGGDVFMKATPVSAEGAHIMAASENGPSFVARGMNQYALWQQSRPGGGVDIMFARSGRMGEPFTAPVRILDKPLSDTSYNGFSRLALAPNGDLYAVWLDGRDQADPEGTFSIYFAKSTDLGSTWSKNIRIAGGVCPCCRPSIAFGDHDEVYIAWRKVFPGDVRDVVVAVSRNGGGSWTEPVRAGVDDWVLHACPDVGPTLAVKGDRLYVAWYSAGGGEASVRMSYSDDGAKTFSAKQIISAGINDATHPEFAVGSDGNIALVFQGRPKREGWSGTAAYVAEISNDSFHKPVEVPAQAAASYPAIALGADTMFVAWTTHTKDSSTIYLTRAER
jgi:hypothetical protein